MIEQTLREISDTIVSLSKRIHDLESNQTVLTGDGDPNAVVSAGEGTIYWDYTNDQLYVNDTVPSPSTSWQSVGGGIGIAHDILSATHSDSTPAAVQRGDIITGQDAVATWQRLAHPGGAGYALITDATDVLWDQTPDWSGLHTFSGGWILNSSTGDLDGNDLIIDTDGDTILDEVADDHVRLELGSGSGQFDIRLEGDTSSVLYPLHLIRTTAGVAAVGMGVGIEYELEVGGIETVAGSHHFEWRDVGGGPSSEFVIHGYGPSEGGGLTEICRIVPGLYSIDGNQRGDGAVDLQNTRSGANEIAAGNYSALVSGYDNTVDGNYSGVLAGYSCSVAGDYSIGLGARAVVNAAHSGTFLWGGSAAGNFNSVAANEFAIRASGGFRHAYDNSNYWTATVDNTGAVAVDMTATAATDIWTFNIDTMLITSSTSAHPYLRLTGTNADPLAPVIEFYKDSASPADNDDLGEVDFYGGTSTSAKERYACIIGESLDVTNGDTSGGLCFQVVMDATERNILELKGYNGSVNEGEVIINEAGQDVDVRIEASGVANALFVRGSDGQIGVNTNSPAGQMTIDQSSTTAAIPVLELDQADLSEEFINFITTVGAGNPIDTAALGAYYGKARVSVNGAPKYVALYDS